MRREQRQATAEPWKEYAFAAELADEHRADALRLCDAAEAAMWGKLAKYCRAKAERQGPPPTERWRALGSDVLPLDECMSVPSSAAVRIRKRDLHAFTRAIIVLILGRLTPQERACFVMIEAELMDDSDVGAALGIPANQVRQHLSRARVKVRTARREIEHLIPGPAPYDPSIWYVRNRAG